MKYLSTRIMPNEVGTHKNDANESAKHKNDAEDGDKHKNNDRRRC